MSGEAVSNNTTAPATHSRGLPLKQVVAELTRYAPLELAESWDNVGLLVEPFTSTPVHRVLLTNDLTRTVMAECVEKNVNLIISYHPPIFVGKKRITNSNWQDQLVSCCLENRIAVYSPHTTWDSVAGGLGDWLASAFGDESSYESVSVLEPYNSFFPADHKYSVVVKQNHLAESTTNTLIIPKLRKIGLHLSNNLEQIECKEFVGSCDESAMPNIYRFLASQDEVTFEIYNRVPVPREKGTGGGRLVKFKQPMTIKTAIDKLKSHLGVSYARIAYAVGANQETLIRSAALVPGSGGKVLAGVRADLYVTGEMLHHDVLAATHRGSSVLTTTHSDSERGFLTLFSDLLRQRLDDRVDVIVSSTDRDPIEIA